MSSTDRADTTFEVRRGVPLSYISEKLSHAIKDTREAGQIHPEACKRLAHVMYSQTKAFLALHNLLAAAYSPGLPEHLLEVTRHELDRWLAAVATHGDLWGADQA
jgi:hypothetical protein